MKESSRSALVVGTATVIGLVIGSLIELSTPWVSTFLGISAVAVFGIGLGIVEGPTLVASIVQARFVTRQWVRSALQASAPFLGFFAYLVGYGLALHPPFHFHVRC